MKLNIYIYWTCCLYEISYSMFICLLDYLSTAFIYSYYVGGLEDLCICATGVDGRYLPVELVWLYVLLIIHKLLLNDCVNLRYD